jgi:hypothetical protein
MKKMISLIVNKIISILKTFSGAVKKLVRRNRLLCAAWAFVVTTHLAFLSGVNIPAGNAIHYASFILLIAVAGWGYLRSALPLGKRTGRRMAVHAVLFLFVFLGIGFFYGSFIVGGLRQLSMLGLIRPSTAVRGIVFVTALFAATFWGVVKLARSSKSKSAAIIENLLVFGSNAAFIIFYVMFASTLFIMR